MKSRNIIYVGLLAVLAMACSKKEQKEQPVVTEDYTQAADEGFKAEPGMHLNLLCNVPGLEWDIDTIYGVCEPDTLVLWAKYGDRYLPTNVRGAEHDFIGLTDNGIKALKCDTIDTYLPTDFTEEAHLLTNLDYSRQRMRADADSVLEKRVREMMGIAKDFFTSYGMTKYMTKSMAANWDKINNEARAEGVEPPNPINGCNIIEFEPGSIEVMVEDAQKGIVRVKAYCLDTYTLGREGWAFWRMTMCKEGRFFKIKTPPMLVRPQEIDF